MTMRDCEQDDFPTAGAQNSSILNPAPVILDPRRALANAAGPTPEIQKAGNKAKEKKPLAAAMKRIVERKPEILEEIASAALFHASAGDAQFFKEVRDTLDGKPVTKIAGGDDEDNPVALRFAEIITKARARAGLPDNDRPEVKK